MKVVYLLISLIEIILTAYLVFALIKADFKLVCTQNAFEKKLNQNILNFKKTKEVLSLIKNGMNAFQKVEKEFNKVKTIKKIVTFILSILYFKKKFR